jgi:hypothetical protein
MATLALAVAGAAVGSALLPAGATILGATLTGAAIGAQVGALGGSLIDNALFGASGRSRVLEGPRLTELRVTGSTEGAPIPRLYGRARLGGQLIWATDFEEEVVTSSQSGGGKGGALGPQSKSVEYHYFASFAVALCEGEIAGIGRVWADGTELDLSTLTHRLHSGSDTQAPDSLIEAREGAGNAPAYRGTAYIVFERLALAPFGNRIPQLSFEVTRAVDPFTSRIRAVTLIPGAGEFVYSPEPVTRKVGAAGNVPENVHTRQGADGGSDWTVALDQLQAALPNVASVNLVVAWFGTDLRAGACQLRPGVDLADKITEPLSWSVAGLDRDEAHLVSLVDGRAAYGGTPSDQTVVAAIQDLKARGLSVTLTPFLLMDIPAGNILTDPYTGAIGQPAYPWRGTITVSPAPGQPGTPDKTSAAAAQVAAFAGTAATSDFSIDGETIVYSGPVEWSYRRFVLHYAHLAEAAGGVDAFIVGTELKGLTSVRDSASSYPFVAALAALAADVKSVVATSATMVTYAADWSEYFGHQPADGSGDVHFHLDPLWSSPAIDAIGIDVYWPLSDWRDGNAHADRQAGAASIYDLAYLAGNIVAGEGYDWYYANPADRGAQMRTSITDTTYGKPWMFRFKDIRSWWLNQHYNRPGGAESATPTAWVPQSKPFWLTELGCPAVDRGANQPNVFIDPKSAQSALPYFSQGKRDDFMQRRYLEAFHDGLDPAQEIYLAGANPVSAVYGERMIDLDRLYVYAWDARPYPAFPADTEAWGDGANWRLGHWLTGRMDNAPLAPTVAAILDEHGFAEHDAAGLNGSLGGLVVDRIMSARDTLQPLELVFFFDTRESGGKIVFAHRGSAPLAAELSPDDLVETRPDAALATLTRAQETDLPASARIAFIAAGGDYSAAVEEARRLAGRSGRVALAEVPLVLDAEQAAEIAEVWVFETWAARERAQFSLPPSRLALEPGDAVRLAANGRTHLLRITEIGEHGARDLEALTLDPDLYAGAPAATRGRGSSVAVIAGQPYVAFLDLPLLRGDEPSAAGYAAVAQSPWPGPIAIYRSPESAGFQLKAVASAPAVTGVTLDPLPAGPASRLDRATSVRVQLDTGTLASVTELALLGGANLAAVRNEDGDWEVLQFLSAVLSAPATYALSGLLRGQGGTEHAMRAPLPAGARFVLLDGALARIDMTEDEVGLAFNWRCGPASRDLGSPSYLQRAHTFRGEGLKPLGPVHIRATRTVGDVNLTWIRRTRIAGDSWDSVEVPLGEAEERYEIDILDGATVKRTLTTTSPAATYTAAQQTADFGAPQSSLSLRICQLSATRGRGVPREATL